ncbi:MAG: hypothetical protein M3405_11880 [Acidobacteriota bacterium]|jgi:hypothetical protein|nr:hypothetical protein [Acidobacteriota bacterium]
MSAALLFDIAIYSIRVSNKDLAKIEQKETVPLTTYEINVAAVRLPDGKVRLVSQ